MCRLSIRSPELYFKSMPLVLFIFSFALDFGCDLNALPYLVVIRNESTSPLGEQLFLRSKTNEPVGEMFLRLRSLPIVLGIGAMLKEAANGGSCYRFLSSLYFVRCISSFCHFSKS